MELETADPSAEKRRLAGPEVESPETDETVVQPEARDFVDTHI
jgi:hypothetical protein